MFSTLLEASANFQCLRLPAGGTQLKAHGNAFTDAVQTQFRLMPPQLGQLTGRFNFGESAAAVEGRIKRDPGKRAQRQRRIPLIPCPLHRSRHQGTSQSSPCCVGMHGELLQVRTATHFLEPGEAGRRAAGDQQVP